MLYEGTRDFYQKFGLFGFTASEEFLRNEIQKKVLPKYLPCFEKVHFCNSYSRNFKQVKLFYILQSPLIKQRHQR